MESWTLENAPIRLFASLHVLAAGAALIVLTFTALFAIGGLERAFSEPDTISAVSAWAFVWVFCGLAAAAANLVWSVSAVRHPTWEKVLKATALSLLILATSPFVWSMLL